MVRKRALNRFQEELLVGGFWFRRDPGGRCAIGRAFNSYGMVFEIEFLLHSLGETSSRFLNKVLCES